MNLTRVLLLLAGLGLAACGDDDVPVDNNNNGNSQQTLCGNGVTEGSEACDDGAANSDIAADACRTDCTLPRCGDGVVDAADTCDDGLANSDEVPDRGSVHRIRPGVPQPCCDSHGCSSRRSGVSEARSIPSWVGIREAAPEDVHRG
jgi:hypothetical protein